MKEALEHSPIEETRLKAIQGLKEYLDSPTEKILREEQVDVIESLCNFLEQGNTAGFIELPMGAGKTIVALEIIAALGLKTVILSPTQTILRQTHRRGMGRVKIGNYYTEEKDLTGDVLNTTYQSFRNLIRGYENGEEGFDPNSFGLIICDEAHTALGEQRHTIFRKLPNALKIGLTATPYFKQLEGFEQRGLINMDEDWVNLFKKRIHKMSLEEGFERGVLAPLNVNLVRTGISVGKVSLISGDYKPSELERYLQSKARDFLTIGMVAGVDKLPPDIYLHTELKDQMSKIHEEIRDKQTVIFGSSIEKIEELATELLRLGVSAFAVHGNLSETEREAHLSLYKKGSIRVLLAVDILGLGWDSPETGAIIMTTPTRSGVKLVQQLGRVLRPDENNPEKIATAIQLVDQFSLSSLPPVLIPAVFDPNFVSLGSQRGAEVHVTPYHPKGKAKVTFSGMNISAILEEERYLIVLKQGLSANTLEELGEAIDYLCDRIWGEDNQATPAQMYQKIADALSYFVTSDVQTQSVEALKGDPSKVSLAKKVIGILNMKTIVMVSKKFAQQYKEDESELMQAALDKVWEQLPEVHTNYDLSLQINRFAESGIASYLSSRYGLSQTVIRDLKVAPVLERVEDEFNESPAGLTAGQIRDLSTELAKITRFTSSYAREYLENRSLVGRELTGLGEDEMVDELYRKLLSRSFWGLVDSTVDLSYRQRSVLEKRYGFGYTGGSKLKELSEELGVSREMVRVVVKQAQTRLKRQALIYLWDLYDTSSEPHKALDEYIKIQLDSYRQNLVLNTKVNSQYREVDNMVDLVTLGESQQMYCPLESLPLSDTAISNLRKVGMKNAGDFINWSSKRSRMVGRLDKSWRQGEVKKLKEDIEEIMMLLGCARQNSRFLRGT